MAAKILGLFLMLLAFTGGYLLIKEETQSTKVKQKTQSSNRSPIILKPWKKNLEKLKAEDLLPPEWQSIRKVRVILLDKNLHSQLKGLKPPISTLRNGEFLLEVSLMSHETDSKDIQEGTGIIFQYNLIDLKSEEMIWEHSSTTYIDL